MKKPCAALLTAAVLLTCFTVPARAEEAAQTAAGAPAVEAPAVLLMEKETGCVLYEENAHDKREPASVTKVMTLLLVMEAIDSGRLS